MCIVGCTIGHIDTPQHMQARFESRFPVASYEVDADGALSLFALFNRFQDLAGLHAAHLGVGYDALRRQSLAWLLSRIRIEIDALPHWGDIVQLATWPKGIERLFALRDFTLADERGDVMLRSTSAWLLVDIQRKRPARIERLDVDLAFENAPDAIADRPERLEAVDALTPVFEHVVRPSDIDVNRHVNNAQYVKWICDCLDNTPSRITSIAIDYLEESRLGDTIILRRSAPRPFTYTPASAIDMPHAHAHAPIGTMHPGSHAIDIDGLRADDASPVFHARITTP